jgi:2-polyprenyl-6-methoxyphenol hydroxylase-like FAD-dependent oxidoreductase
MNTGIADAHNIAWKLAVRHHGAATRDILSSYHKERHPVAWANTRHSVKNYGRTIQAAAKVCTLLSSAVSKASLSS